VIIAEEIARLHDYGVERIYSPEDGQQLGLVGMIEHMVVAAQARRDEHRATLAPQRSVSAPLFTEQHAQFVSEQHRPLATLLTAIENQTLSESALQQLAKAASAVSRAVPVLGITGTGGAGKSSVTDELIRRLRFDQGDECSVALLAIDPTRRRSGGALLGDRIRMNAINHPSIFMRSVATRDASGEVPGCLPAMLDACRLSGVDLIVVETPGIGQGDAGIVPYCDTSLYVMTPEFGAASQLEKIDMLDYADVIAINKCNVTARRLAKPPTQCRFSAPWQHVLTMTASVLSIIV